MKKTLVILSFLLSVSLCSCMLASCGEKASEASSNAVSSAAQNDTGDQQLSAVYDKIVEESSLPEMYTMTDGYIESYFGLTSDVMEDKVFASAEDALLADTVAIVKVPEGVDTGVVEAAFKTVKEQKMIELESYNPDQYQRVKKASIKTIGQYVCYIVSDDNDAILNIIESSIA